MFHQDIHQFSSKPYVQQHELPVSNLLVFLVIRILVYLHRHTLSLDLCLVQSFLEQALLLLQEFYLLQDHFRQNLLHLKMLKVVVKL